MPPAIVVLDLLRIDGRLARLVFRRAAGPQVTPSREMDCRNYAGLLPRSVWDVLNMSAIFVFRGGQDHPQPKLQRGSLKRQVELNPLPLGKQVM